MSAAAFTRIACTAADGQDYDVVFRGSHAVAVYIVHDRCSHCGQASRRRLWRAKQPSAPRPKAAAAIAAARMVLA